MHCGHCSPAGTYPQAFFAYRGLLKELARCRSGLEAPRKRPHLGNPMLFLFSFHRFGNQLSASLVEALAGARAFVGQRVAVYTSLGAL